MQNSRTPYYRFIAPLLVLISLACVCLAAGAATGLPGAEQTLQPAAPMAVHADVIHANFGGTAAASDVVLVADWFMRTGKAAGRPFVIADKTDGWLFAFRENGELFAKVRALYGATRSDAMTREQADKALGDLTAADMITPAGIFPAQAYESPAHGPAVRFARYARTNLLIHRAPAEWRRKYLLSAASARDRVTHGCINVLPQSLDEVLLPVLRQGATLVVLPEQQSARSFFGIVDTAANTAASETGAAAIGHAATVMTSAPGTFGL